MPFCYRCPDNTEGKAEFYRSEYTWVPHTLFWHGPHALMPWIRNKIGDYRFAFSKWSHGTKKPRLSMVPVIREQELSEDYRDLGETLNELSNLDSEDEWRIGGAVRDAASHVATQLISCGIPAPRVFTHGSESIVFNWSNKKNNNLYLTISANRISALISTPERIVQRMEFSASKPSDT